MLDGPAEEKMEGRLLGLDDGSELGSLDGSDEGSRECFKDG